MYVCRLSSNLIDRELCQIQSWLATYTREKIVERSRGWAGRVFFADWLGRAPKGEGAVGAVSYLRCSGPEIDGMGTLDCLEYWFGMPCLILWFEGWSMIECRWFITAPEVKRGLYNCTIMYRSCPLSRAGVRPALCIATSIKVQTMPHPSPAELG
jgi:hypothetical protein